MSFRVHRGNRDAIIAMSRTVARRTEMPEAFPAELGESGLVPVGKVTKIDLAGAPYNITCPACHAHACALCQVFVQETGRRRILFTPHQERWEYWHDRPDLHVIAVR